MIVWCLIKLVDFIDLVTFSLSLAIVIVSFCIDCIDFISNYCAFFRTLRLPTVLACAYWVLGCVITLSIVSVMNFGYPIESIISFKYQSINQSITVHPLQIIFNNRLLIKPSLSITDQSNFINHSQPLTSY